MLRKSKLSTAATGTPEQIEAVERMIERVRFVMPSINTAALDLVPARWANSTLENSITVENETNRFFRSTSILDLQRGLLGGELWNHEAPLRWVRFLRKRSLGPELHRRLSACSR